MKNKLTDLNDHLFAQLERLGDESLDSEKLKDEIARSKAITAVSSQIVNNARLALDAQIAVRDLQLGNRLPSMLEAKP
ncbi:hypothetical protein KAM344_17220 [Aeromonas caviae]|uniref:Phage protein n=1 Tax=Aeromonas caviae TaxID=648 RepID=A0AA37LKR6_AERCA|nr:hypothetical protein [Aeromonas caviae]WGY77558.1 hypothetical protein MLL77_20705 [Aeromonas caviae]GJA64085.1 hypothetical protein KAM351_26960 [Aeromonas caviae]GJB74823.1 hypothetical protein KAM379_38810 [Aeromonas caviae]GKQ66557.1 hypothetical protein KAM344_17220 [Aeromonas caviae]